jgi:hypothetical protein
MADRRRDLGSGAGAAAPPASVEEALARARRHARGAVSESLATVQALLDAAALATSGRPSEATTWLAPVARTLEGLSASLAGDSDPRSEPLLNALADALDAEIARWEQRASSGDTDARAVLRAFLGVRELLWELGVRGPEKSGASPDRPRRRSRGGPGRRRGPRVQRVPGEG